MRPDRGFTLVELVMVIMLMGIIGVSSILFIKTAVDGNVAMERRSRLTDQADSALRRMSREVKSSVPNSIRTPGSQCFELIPTSGGGRYRMESDTVAAGSIPLDTSGPSTGFDVLSGMTKVPAVGDWVVIGNQDPSDVYSGLNSAQLTSVTVPAATAGKLRLGFASTQFPAGYDGGRFVIVPNNGGNQSVTYVCAGADGTLNSNGNGNGTLYRVSRPISAAYPTSCPSVSGAAIVATHVRSCNFTYDPSLGATQQNGYVWLEAELTENNESVRLAGGAHVDNAP